VPLSGTTTSALPLSPPPEEEDEDAASPSFAAPSRLESAPVEDPASGLLSRSLVEIRSEHAERPSDPRRYEAKSHDRRTPKSLAVVASSID